jgi:hypothetical protein
MLDEQFPPSIRDGLDVLACQWCRQRCTCPRGQVLNRRQAIQHCTPHPTIHLATSLSLPWQTSRAHSPRSTTRPSYRHAAVHCLPDVARGLKPPSPCCRAGALRPWRRAERIDEMISRAWLDAHTATSGQPCDSRQAGLLDQGRPGGPEQRDAAEILAGAKSTRIA